MIQDGVTKEKDKWIDIKSLGKWKPAADSLTVLLTGLEVRILLHHLCAVRPVEQSRLFPDLEPCLTVGLQSSAYKRV